METKKQRKDKSTWPVIWGIHTSQTIATQVEEYARKNNICEGDVFRRGLKLLLGAPKHLNLTGIMHARNFLTKKHDK